jgi:MYXO-CTERM domain-containing protein
MRTITLTIILLFAATAADAAWYQKTDGTIVDPIQSQMGGDHSYSGNNLQPGADLEGSYLTDAWLGGAELTNADLSNSYLDWANLTSANLTSANLTSALLFGTKLTDADLSGSILTATRFWNTATWTDAFYYTDNEPTWDSGMDAAWRSSAGILALAPTSAVPEPAAILLALLGLALLPRRRRR